MLEPHNVRMEPSNVRKKKVRELPNVRKKRSHVMLELHNVRMEPSNVRKSKGTTKCEKKTITYDVGTAQYKDRTVKCEKKVTWCSRLPTSGYRTPVFLGGYRRITPLLYGSITNTIFISTNYSILL